MSNTQSNAEEPSEFGISSSDMREFRRLNEELRREELTALDRTQMVWTLYESRLSGHLVDYVRNNVVAGLIERAMPSLDAPLLRRIVLDIAPAITRLIYHVQASHVIQTALLLLPRLEQADRAARAEGEGVGVVDVITDQFTVVCGELPKVCGSETAAGVLKTWMNVVCGRADASRRFVVARDVQRIDPATVHAPAATAVLTSVARYIGNPRNRLVLNVCQTPQGAGLVAAFFNVLADTTLPAALPAADIAEIGELGVGAACALIGIETPAQPVRALRDIFRFLTTPAFTFAAEAAIKCLPSVVGASVAQQIVTFTTTQKPGTAFEHPKMPCISMPGPRALLCTCLRMATPQVLAAAATAAASNFNDLCTTRGFGIICAIIEAAGKLHAAKAIQPLPTTPITPADAKKPEVSAMFALVKLLKKIYAAAGVKNPADPAQTGRFIRDFCGLGTGAHATPAVKCEVEWLPEEKRDKPRGRQDPEKVAAALEKRRSLAAQGASYTICATLVKHLPLAQAEPVVEAVAVFGASETNTDALLRVAADPNGGTLLAAFFESRLATPDRKADVWRYLSQHTAMLALTPAGSFVVEAAVQNMPRKASLQIMQSLRNASAQLSREPAGRALWRAVRGADYLANDGEWWTRLQADVKARNRLAKAVGVGASIAAQAAKNQAQAQAGAARPAPADDSEGDFTDDN